MTARKLVSPDSTLKMEASTGNSSPVTRSPHCDPGPSILRPTFSLSTKRRRPSLYSARKRRGIKRPMEFPIASLAEMPNILSAAELNNTTRWASSMAMIASIADSTIPAERSLLSFSLIICVRSLKFITITLPVNGFRTLWNFHEDEQVETVLHRDRPRVLRESSVGVSLLRDHRI